MKKIVFIFLFLAFGVLQAQEHEATIHFRDGTNLTGYAYIKDMWIIKFRLNLEDKADEWKDIMVKGVTFHLFEKDITYEYQYNYYDKSYPILLEVLEEGNVNVYIDSLKYYIIHIGNEPEKPGNFYVKEMQSNIIYFRKPGEELIKSFTKKFYNKQAQEYFKDCPSLVVKFKEEKFIKKKRLEYLQFYNDWCDDEIAGSLED